MKIQELYSSLSKNHLDGVQNALCPFQIELPQSLLTQIKLIVSEFVNAKKESAKNWSPSVLNSLDFHFSSESLKIIEANTNASGYMLSNLLEKDPKTVLQYEASVLSSFKKVLNLSTSDSLCICDEDPEAEKMFPEFLMYKDFFKRNNITVQIKKTGEVSIGEDKNVYNRDTDFYLENQPLLKKAWLAQKIKLTPDPLAYQNIASKKQPILTESQAQTSDYSLLKKAVLKTHTLTEHNREELWAVRKKLFFKPAEAFGSKGVYSGKSISKSKFLNLPNGHLAQELHPPGKIFKNEQDWKFDLRAYFSEGEEVQKVVARLYQGQLTNFSQPGGGFALINWV